MYYTGIDPFTKKAVHTAKNVRDRKLQRALMQFFKPEKYFEVREALTLANRPDLIGVCKWLIPADPPKEAIEARRMQSNVTARVANLAEGEVPGERACPRKQKDGDR